MAVTTKQLFKAPTKDFKGNIITDQQWLKWLTVISSFWTRTLPSVLLEVHDSAPSGAEEGMVAMASTTWQSKQAHTIPVYYDGSNWRAIYDDGTI